MMKNRDKKMRLIDADALIRKLCAERDEVQIEHACDIGYHNGLNMAVSMTINAPTIDPESLRPQGEWMVTYYTTTSKRGRVIANAKYVCPKCEHSNGRKRSNYCPNCGAKMKGAENHA